MKYDIPKNFMDKITITDSCWLWNAYIHREGYGQYGVNKKTIGAHRYAWTICFGEIPKGLLVCHKCDVRHCVNPEHLFLGTNKDNIQDMIAKGRANWPKGFKANQGIPRTYNTSKLSNDQVSEIRKTHCNKKEKTNEFSSSKLAKKYGISRSHVYRIVTKKRRFIQEVG